MITCHPDNNRFAQPNAGGAHRNKKEIICPLILRKIYTNSNYQDKEQTHILKSKAQQNLDLIMQSKQN